MRRFNSASLRHSSGHSCIWDIKLISYRIEVQCNNSWSMHFTRVTSGNTSRIKNTGSRMNLSTAFASDRFHPRESLNHSSILMIPEYFYGNNGILEYFHNTRVFSWFSSRVFLISFSITAYRGSHTHAVWPKDSIVESTVPKLLKSPNLFQIDKFEIRIGQYRFHLEQIRIRIESHWTK